MCDLSPTTLVSLDSPTFVQNSLDTVPRKQSFEQPPATVPTGSPHSTHSPQERTSRFHHLFSPQKHIPRGEGTVSRQEGRETDQPRGESRSG